MDKIKQLLDSSLECDQLLGVELLKVRFNKFTIYTILEIFLSTLASILIVPLIFSIILLVAGKGRPRFISGRLLIYLRKHPEIDIDTFIGAHTKPVISPATWLVFLIYFLLVQTKILKDD